MAIVPIPPVAALSNGSILVMDLAAGTGAKGALFSVNPSTGARTIVSDFGSGANPGAGAELGVAIDASGNILVMDFFAGTLGKGALFSVNPSTGARTIVSDFGSGANPGAGAEQFIAIVGASQRSAALTSPAVKFSTYGNNGAGLGSVATSATPAGASASGLTFPLGFFTFTVAPVTVGGSVSVTFTFPPGVSTAGAVWVKCSGGVCHKIAPTATTATTITFTLTDGDPNTDDDGVANGAILDQGGPGFPAAPGAGIPAGIPEYPLEPVPIIALIGALALFFLIRRRVP